MNVIKKLLLTLNGTVDAIVIKVQNHDALTSAALEELQAQIGKARVSFTSLGKQLEKTDQAIEQAVEDEQVWRERAKTTALKHNRETALECLKRSHQAQEKSVRLQEQRATSAAAYQLLHKKLSELEVTYQSLHLKKQKLKAEEQCRTAESSCNHLTTDSVGAMLDEWESALSSTTASFARDALEDSFTSEEDRKQLEAELEALTK